MNERTIYTSDIKYQQLENEIVGTTMDIFTYCPLAPYKPTWTISEDED